MAEGNEPRPLQVQKIEMTKTTGGNGQISLPWEELGNLRPISLFIRGGYRVGFITYTDNWWAMIYQWPALTPVANENINFVLYCIDA